MMYVDDTYITRTGDNEDIDSSMIEKMLKLGTYPKYDENCIYVVWVKAEVTMYSY